MKKMQGIVPGVFTMGNMFCGFLSILASLDGQAVTAAWLVIMAAFFDALDGWIARFSRSTTPYGIELDSFADFVSFGIAPAVMLYSFKLFIFGKWGFILGFVFIVCGAFRLARFNLSANPEKKLYYTGLPIPIAAATFAGYTLFCFHIWGELRYPEFIISLIVGFSALMVSNIKYDTLPNANFRSRHNNFKLIFTLLAGTAIFIKPQLAFFPIGISYILLGVARELSLLARTSQPHSQTEKSPEKQNS
ncbi:MAG: CDP-diacylglycerol--serine O-phosphatidyltransferase [candidate division Zixibacteria bacterium]|nr:CDP-diacylglycerol--serine O-phosphatidyltransferase [candidate division Zixibacteria bacterium]